MQEGLRELSRGFLQDRLWRAVLVGFFLFFSLSLIMAFQFIPSQVNLQVGDVSPTDIRAPRRIAYTSEVMTEEERKRAAASVAPVYDPADPEILRRQMEWAQAVFSYVDSIRHDPYSSPETRKGLLAAILGVSLTEESLDQTLGATDEEWELVVTESSYLLDQIMRQNIRPETVAEVKRQVPSRVSLSLSPQQASLVETWVVNFIVPNSFINETLTEEERTAARQSVEPVAVTVEQGEMILRVGDVTTPFAWEKLGALGLRQPTVAWPDIFSRLLFTLSMVGVLTVYLSRLKPRFWDDGRKVLIVVLLLITGVLGAKIMVPGPDLLRYFFPMAAISMLLTTLVDPEIAILTTAVLSLFLGFIGGGLELTLYGLVGGVIAGLRLYRVDRVNTFLWAGLWVAVANVAVLVIFNLPAAQNDIDWLAFLGAGLGNGALSASLALGGFFVLSNLLGMVTPLQLLELARPNHPLLKELLLKAPGTYHHSLMVSNLAEQAAEAIGADPLLARVGAYYHDVGKTMRPYLFIENQEEGINIHDRLDPKLSAQMVIAHVQDGLDLAKKHALPQGVRDFIPQHHGTTKASYFYRQAEEADPEEFQYPGPRPQSREAGIVMLADGVEATIRAERPDSLEKAQEIVDRIVEARLREGQLDSTDLTLRDLEKIKETLLKVLEGMYHPRIRYPEEGGENTSGRAGNSQKTAVTSQDRVGET